MEHDAVWGRIGGDEQVIDVHHGGYGPLSIGIEVHREQLGVLLQSLGPSPQTCMGGIGTGGGFSSSAEVSPPPPLPLLPPLSVPFPPFAAPLPPPAKDKVDIAQSIELPHS